MKNEQQLHDIVVSMRLDGAPWKYVAEAVAEKLGQSYTVPSLRRTSNRKGWTREIQETKDKTREMKQSFKKDTGEITTKSLDIQSVDDLLEYADVDQEVWEVDRYIINTWETTMGADSANTGNPETYTNYQVKVWLKRIKKDAVALGFEDLINELRDKPVRVPAQFEQFEDEVVMFMGVFDHHFGKLAWHAETNNDYDLKIAKKAFLGAVEDLLKHAVVYNISKIVFPLGNDYFQIDNYINGKLGVTANGTPQDTDGRMAKILRTGMIAMIEAVEMCLSVAPVEVIWVPGNHDWNTSFGLANIIDARFHDEDRVEVDVSPNPRKYRRFGKTLIGLTHGNEEKHIDLPTIMAGEAKKDWAEADDYMWFLGHFHRRKEMRFNAGDTFGAVQIRILPSLSGADAWHHKKGYVNTDRAAEAYFFHHDRGYLGHACVKIRKELQGDVA